MRILLAVLLALVIAGCTQNIYIDSSTWKAPITSVSGDTTTTIDNDTTTDNDSDTSITK